MRSESKNDELYKIRHSLAHILASAVQNIWPHAKFGVGPVVENGFYYDIDLGAKTISEEDFPHIEAEMNNIIKADQKFVKTELSIDKAIQWATDNRQPYKQELLNDLKRTGTTAVANLDAKELGLPAGEKSKIEKVSFYACGGFMDLCRGPHVSSTAKTGVFKLLRVAGAYWRGDETKPQMQRVYGVAFETEAELKDYLELSEQAKKRDHRKLGRELGLFAFSDLVGSGLPLFTPAGTILRNLLADYSKELRSRLGFEEVWIPHLTKKELYETSGHWAKFGEELLLVNSRETSDELVLKPMNCPHHIQIYASSPKSYRDLPVRYMENTTVYRDEKSGELHGIERVRSITQDDCHVFCSDEQVGECVDGLVSVTSELYEVLGMPIKRVHLSFRDGSDQYLGDDKLWRSAQKTLEKQASRNKLKYVIDEGEAAFYGPKIDFIAEDALRRETQVATIQLDFVQPARFSLEYIDKDNSAKCPVMIHAALLGSVERFLSVYIEHTAGKFPPWLAPEQVRLLTVNQEDKTVKFAEQILQQGKEQGLRITLDNDNQSVAKKIRNAELMKIPYVVVIGDKEIKSSKVIPRIREDMVVANKEQPIGIEQFLKTVVNETKNRTTKTSM